jgi:hypothetical protein
VNVASEIGIAPFIYVVLLQCALAFLQQPALVLVKEQTKKGSATSIPPWHWPARAVATLLNWISWILSIHVGSKFGISIGILFFALAFGASVASTILVISFPPLGLVGALICLLASIYFFLSTLLSLGIELSTK